MIVTEIITMRIVEGITKEEFISTVDGLEKNFHSKQSGFMDTELLYHENNDQWYMIQHWSSRDELKEASKKIFTDVNAEDFINSLNKSSINILILPQIATW